MIVLFMGVDPAQRRSAVVLLLPGAGFKATTIDGIENLSGFNPIEWVDQLCPLHNDDYQVIACVERPMWKGPAGKETRAAASAWERYLNRKFGRRAVVCRASPEQWQRDVLGVKPSDDTKRTSIIRARAVLKLPQSVDLDHNIADAANLADMAALLFRTQQHLKPIAQKKGGGNNQKTTGR